MKVKIGKYLNWYGPYQLMDILFFWHVKYPKDEIAKRWDYKLHRQMSEWLASTWVADFCQWIHNHRKRTEKIHIDNYDVWNMPETLASIIVPMLKELKKQKHSYGWTDHEDGPWYYRFEDYKEEHSWTETGSYSHGRYDWIFDEMIWAFEQIINEDYEAPYWLERGEIDWDHGIVNEDNTIPVIWKKESRVDWDGIKRHNDTIQNGLRLFGKYYRSLWD